MEFPNVELESHTGERINPSGYDKAIVYFFPKAFTSGCTKEAVRFNELYDEFKALGFEVFGVSVDSVETLKKFAERYGLKFKLLSDRGGELAKKLGILRPSGTAERVTYVLKSGTIVEQIKGLRSADQHADKALEIARRLQR